MTVPSRISYDERAGPRIKYGHSVRGISHDLMDLGLANVDFVEEAGRSSVDLWVDFLTQVRKDVWEGLETTYNAPPSSLPKELMVTLPENWPERAKNRFLMAVYASSWDFKTVTLVPGSEASSIALLKRIAKDPKESIGVGDCFVM